MGSNDIQTKDNNCRKVDLAVSLACKLLCAGAPVNKAERAAIVVCKAYGATSVNAFCVPNAIVVTAYFGKVVQTALKRAYYGGNDLLLQEQCANIVREISAKRLTLQGAESKVNSLRSAGAPPLYAALGSFLACGSFAIFFGGNFADGVIAATAGLITSCVSALLDKRGTGGCARVFALSAVSGLLSVLLCALMQLMGITCHTSLALVGTLMTLIPGLTVCNALSDMVSGELFSGIYRIFGGLSQTVCIVAGYALALTASGGLTAFTLAVPRADALHIIICYITSASGAAGFCLTMNARKKRLLYGVAAASLSYTAYVIANFLGANEFSAYFVSAIAAYAAAEVPARVAQIPSNLFVAPAVIPLLPGANMYFAVNALVCGDSATALACGSDALIIFTAIAAGLAAAELAARIILPKKHTVL